MNDETYTAKYIKRKKVSHNSDICFNGENVI